MRDQLKAEQAMKEQAKKVDPERMQREQQLINLITNIFRTREITFFDAFREDYDSLNPINFISMSQFKAHVRTLNLPLTVQD